MYVQMISIYSCIKTYVCIYLQYGHLIPQLTLLLGGKAKLVNDFDSYIPPCFPVLT